MSARLIEMGNAPEERREILIGTDEFLIGRGLDCDLRLNESAVSRHHCLLRRDGNDYLLLDLGSSNGTYLNGQRLISQASLHTGDRISIGDFHFQIDLADRVGIDWGKAGGSRPDARTIHVTRSPQKDTSTPDNPHLRQAPGPIEPRDSGRPVADKDPDHR